MLTLPRGSVLPLADGPFDLVAGLPMHPLVVHVAVVILPLSALALIALVLVPRLRRPLGWLTLAGLAVGAVAAFVAKESGEALAERVGLPTEHADYGNVLPLLAVVLLLVAAAWFLLQRRDAAREGGQSVGTTITGIVAIVLALATTGLTVVVGHTGATAAWSDVVAAAPAADDDGGSSPATSAPAASGSTSTPEPLSTGSSGSSSGSSSAAGTYTMADVATHADASSCWAAINGSVYDLTAWINQHPGGPQRILALCGTDATSAFTAQHGGQARPEKELATFEIGTVSTASPAAFTTAPARKRTYTMAQVQAHASASSCWTVIGKGVYDVTRWINRHPGGSSRILALCGRDGTSAFSAQHGNDGRAKAQLATFRIGRLAAPRAA